MYVTCKDVLNLDLFHTSKILTGDVGLDRVISWPYLAKALLDEQYFTGGELVIIAETYIQYNEEILLSFIDVCSNCHISGILFFIDHESNNLNHVPDSVIAKAIENNIPIIETPWDVRSIDVVRQISFLVFQNEQRVDALQNCFKNIIFFPYDNLQDTDAFKQLINLGYCDTPYYLLRIQLFDFDEYCSLKKLDTELKRHEQKKFIRHYIHRTVADYFPDTISCSNSDIIVSIIDDCKYNDFSMIIDKIEKLNSHLLKTFSILNIKMCLTKKYDSIYDIKTAFHDTTHIIELCNLKEFQELPVIYDMIGIYKLLLASNKTNLRSIYESTFAPLIEFDKENDSNLIETLSCYLHSNCNLEETSQKLFIHINTIRYRIKKIESLTGMSLKSTDDLSVLCFCVHIKTFLMI